MQSHIKQTICFVVAVWIAAGGIAFADRIQPMSLEEISKQAERIFEGECLSVKTGKDPQSGLAATWYVFRVIEPIQGEFDETFTLKQYGGVVDGETLLTPSARYETGERVILFLYGESRIGFSSAVGLTQGKFRVIEDEKQTFRAVSNGMPAAALFKDLSRVPTAYSPQGQPLSGARRYQALRLDKDEFVATVKEILETQKRNEERPRQ